MKKLLTLFFLVSLMTAHAQRKDSHYDYNSNNDTRKNIGYGLTVGGVALTTAAIIEGGSQYGTYVNVAPTSSNGYMTTQYVTPPVYQQTPRNIMFCVGIGFTITGLITALAK